MRHWDGPDAWTHRVASSITSPEAAVRPMDFDEAQAWSNFVLFAPRATPEGTLVAHAMMRPEAPPGRVADADGAGRPPWSESNRAAHRCELVGAGRRLRIKQFFYDWAPASFDHPGLWKSETRGFLVGWHVGWLGRDYEGRPGAAMCLRRTTIEVSVLDGAFRDDELIALCRGLAPVSAAVAARIDATSFGRLMYGARHAAATVRVPTGYWAYQREPRDLAVVIFEDRGFPAGLPGATTTFPDDAYLALDTVQVFGRLGSPQEVEWLYRDPADAGRFARICASPTGTPRGLPYPPALDQQPCKSRTLEVHGTTVHHAWREDALGPHEAVWERGGETILLLTKPMVDCDLAWFERLLDRVVSGR